MIEVVYATMNRRCIRLLTKEINVALKHARLASNFSESRVSCLALGRKIFLQKNLLSKADVSFILKQQGDLSFQLKYLGDRFRQNGFRFFKKTEGEASKSGSGKEGEKGEGGPFNL